ncbi:Hydroxyacid oxidase, partial [Lachnellula suecica]
MARLAHPAGERGIAASIARFGALQTISNYASMTPEQITADAAPGQPGPGEERAKVDEDWGVGEEGWVCVLDACSPVSGKREDDERAGNVLLARENVAVAAGSVGTKNRGIAQEMVGPTAGLTWKVTLEWLVRHTELPIALKGVQTYEDAYLAAPCHPQVRAIIVSNHGGRNLDTASPAVHTLLEVRKNCPEVFDSVE